MNRSLISQVIKWSIIALIGYWIWNLYSFVTEQDRGMGGIAVYLMIIGLGVVQAALILLTIKDLIQFGIMRRRAVVQSKDGSDLSDRSSDE